MTYSLSLFFSLFDNKASGWQLLTSCFLTFLFTPALNRARPASPVALALKLQGENIRGKKYRTSLPVTDSLWGTDTQFPNGKLSQRFVYSIAGRTGLFMRSARGDFHPKPHLWKKICCFFFFLHLRSNCTFKSIQQYILIYDFKKNNTPSITGQIHTFKKTPRHKRNNAFNKLFI